jgi:hypothetical protein
MTDEKDMVIKIKDKYGDCLSDSSMGSGLKKSAERPKGFVEIYEVDKDTKKLIAKPNLVVFQGREGLLSSAFRTRNVNIAPLEDEFICWFGVGNGGCPIGDPLNPTAPTVEDLDLVSNVMINASDATCGDWRVEPEVEGYYKHPFDSVSFEQDPDNYNYWLVGRISTTISNEDANGYNLNEAGLFSAASSAGSYSGHFSLYARVTFPTIVKTDSRQLLFVWYVYF